MRVSRLAASQLMLIEASLAVLGQLGHHFRLWKPLFYHIRADGATSASGLCKPKAPRFGLPAGEPEWQRLVAAMAAFHSAGLGQA
jgi:hypothetical protein